MNVGSLFAGIGGFDLGLERAGMRTAWQVEQDPYCLAVLAKHFPDAERFTDVREVGAHNLAPVDLICGGFPCQDISLAGRGAGIGGERSGLWGEMWRVIRELGPRWVVVENVPALTSRGLDRVLRDLASGGYDAEWDCIPAAALGAPHRRDRIWLVAYPQRDELREQPTRLTGGHDAPVAGDDGEARSLADAQGDHEPHEPRVADARRALVGTGPGAGGGAGRGDSPARDREPRPDQESRCPVSLADAARDGEEGAEAPAGAERQRARPGSQRSGASADPNARGFEGEPQRDGEATQPGLQAPQRHDADGLCGPDWWATEPDVGRVADGVPARVDRLSALGNALVPQIAEWIGRRIVEHEEGGLT